MIVIKMKRLWTLLIFILILGGWFPHGFYGAPPSTLSAFKIGAGGYVVGLNIVCDTTCGNGSGTSTKVARPDTYGAFLFNASAANPGNAGGTGVWQNIADAASIPSADQYINPEETNSRYAVEIRVAPSNTNIFYMMWDPGYPDRTRNIYTSTNRGAAWTKQTGFPNYSDTLANFTSRYFGPFIAIDPSSSNIAFVGSPSGAAGPGQVTLDGGSTFNPLPLPAPIANVTGIASIGYTINTSSSSNTIGTGTVNFTTTNSCPSLAPCLGAGSSVQIYETSGPANQFLGTVISNSGTSLSVNVTFGAGSGTYSDWTVVNQAGLWQLLAFDPSSTSGGHTNGAYACVSEVGVFHSTNAESGASSTWTELNSTGMPTSCSHIVVDATGTLWVVGIVVNNDDLCLSNNCDLYSYSGGSWTHYATGSGALQAVTVDPYNSNAVYAVDTTGKVYVSINHGASFIGPTISKIATDAPWLASADSPTYFSPSDATIDPAQTQWTTSTTSNTVAGSGSLTFTTASSSFGNLPVGTIVTIYETSNSANVMNGTVAAGSSSSTLNITLTASSGSGTHTDWTVGTNVLYLATGIGIFYGTPPAVATQNMVYNSQNTAIENMVTDWASSPWWGGSEPAACSSSFPGATTVPILVHKDRPFFATTGALYPLTYGPNSSFSPGSYGATTDWQGTKPANIVGVTNYLGAGIYTSSNCGATWTGTLTVPPEIGAEVTAGAAIAAAAVTTNNIVVMGGNFTGTYNTSDGGATWNVVGFPTGIPSAGAVTATGTTVGGTQIDINVPTWMVNNPSATQYAIQDLTHYAATGLVTLTTHSTYVTLSGSVSGTITSGDQVMFRTNSGFGNHVPLAADRVNDSTFYFFTRAGNTGGLPNLECDATACLVGAFKSTDGGTTWAQQCSFYANPTTCPFGGTGNNGLAIIKATPGVGGDLWWIQGLYFNIGSGPNTGGTGNGHPASCNPAGGSYACLWHSTDGGAHWSNISGVSEPACVGIGKPLSGSDGYPTIYIYGWYNNGSGAVGGLWQAKNIDSTPTWTKLAGLFPGNSIDTLWNCEGDGNIAGQAYVGYEGSSWQYYH